MNAGIIFDLSDIGILNQFEINNERKSPILKNIKPIKIKVISPVLITLFKVFFLILSVFAAIAFVKGTPIPKSVKLKNPIIEELASQKPYVLCEVNFKISGTVNIFSNITNIWPPKSVKKPKIASFFLF
jgi:hypothetical protein